MAKIFEHCLDCKCYLNNSYEYIHEFIDQYSTFYPINKYFEYHRTFLHNSYGLEIIKAKYGIEGEKAFRIHMVRDWKECNIKHLRLKVILELSNKALMFFNNMNNFLHIEKDKVWRTINGTTRTRFRNTN